jgi:hypothetical protein
VAASRPPNIFINYRRDDTSGYSGRLYDALAARFGHESVFMDIDAIEPGEDFTQVVQRRVGSCDVLIALIGRQWLTTSDREGRPRLQKPNDWVRIELQTGLESARTTVIPALVHDVEMPSPDQLPEPLRPLCDRNAIELSDARWKFDVERLIRRLEEIAGLTPPVPAPSHPSRPRPRWLLPGAAAGIVAVALLVAVLARLSQPQSQPPPASNGLRSCGGNLSANQHASCPFAEAVYRKVAIDNSSAQGTYSVHSSVTGRDYSMSCDFEQTRIVCRGGNDAVVSWPG